MSKFVADHLPDILVASLSTATAFDRADQAIVICTIDEHGWPHPAMLSTLEVVAKDARNLRIGTHVSSRSTRNLKANGIVSMIHVNDGAVYYIKGDALLLDAAISVAPKMARFNVRVDSVLQDSPAEYEDAVIVSGIQVRRENLHEPAARDILEELVR